MSQGAPRRVLTLAGSTTRELLRRPGSFVALLITGTLLILLPGLARRALDDGQALGVELSISTVALHASLLAGLVAVHAGSPGTALGPVPEFLATPLGWGEYVIARALGVSAAAFLHVVLLGSVALVALAATTNEPLPETTQVLAAAGSVSLQVTLFVAAGLAAGAFGGAQMGTVAVVALFVATRLVIPEFTADPASWGVLLPDAARVDVGRNLAHAQPIGAKAWPMLFLGCVTQSAALLLAAFWRLSGTAPTGRDDA